jgi:Sulfatase
MSGSIGAGRAALQLGGLWALAFAQPLLELLGRNAPFFVAHESTAGDILVFAFGYVLVPPLLAAALVWALGRIRPVAGWAAMLVLVALLVAGLLLPSLGDALGGSAWAIPVALALGAAAAALYARLAVVRSFMTVLAPAPLVVLLLFLVFSPVHELVLPGDDGGSVGGPASSSVPIVQIVLDELPASTLAHAGGTIDAELFPNLARFAREATWYRSATTVDDLTTEAVPAQLTGMRPRQGSLPTTRDHPRNLFTLFQRSHAMTVVEPITDLCPERSCSESRSGMADRLRSLESDLELVVQHLLLPDDLRERLPAIDRVWEGFEAGSEPAPGDIRGGSLLRQDVLSRLAADDATVGFQRAVKALDEPSSRPPLVFVHSTLPHGPWRYLPDGRHYPIEGYEYPGLASTGWIGPQWQVDQAFARHVLQVQYADRLVGALLNKLRARGLFDSSVVVVTADHGASFRTGEPRRPANAANIGEIAPVPFFVKYPGQRRGRVDERAVRTIDVLPTIAAAAGVRVPWRTDGIPAGERPVDPDAPVDISHAGKHVLTKPLGAVLAKRDERAAVDTRLLRAGPYAVGPRPELIGRRVAAGSGSRPARSPYVTGELDRLEAGTEIAVAVDDVIEATTRTYHNGGHTRYATLVPPSSLRPGARLALLQILPGGGVRPIG